MYKLTRFVSYIEKNNILAVYCNFNLFFLKNDAYKALKSIINSDTPTEINEDFINWLLDKEIIRKSDGD